MGDWFEKVTIGAMLDRAAARFGTREALTCAGQRWGFEAFKADCERAARGLIQCGVQPGEHVSLWLPNRPEWLHVMFAVAKIGAVSYGTSGLCPDGPLQSAYRVAGGGTGE